MKRITVTVTVVLTAFIILMDIRGLLVMWKPYGLQLHTPPRTELQRNIPLGGLAWAQQGSVSLRAALIDPASGNAVAEINLVRDRVEYKGKVLYELASFRAHIQAPAAGTYLLRVELLDETSVPRAKIERTISVLDNTPDREFRMFSPSHFAALAVLFVLCLGLFWLCRSVSLTPNAKEWLAFVMYTLMLTNEAVYHVYWQSTGAWSVSTALMFHMCGLSILLLPWLFIVKPGRFGHILFEMMYFWGLGGALQALLTPDIGLLGYPSFKYFSFFISHGFIILLTLYASLTLPYRITVKSLIRVIGISNLIIFIIYIINKLVVFLPPYEVGNYFVLSYPPLTGSLVDVFVALFGPSPWYFIGFELMGLVVFGILTVPWYIGKVKKHDPL
ncbi:MAG: TIGR02206 family membrane protein [Treponema sp.]|nr:TIGR02206 family membrane protein [Treponema sp.]